MHGYFESPEELQAAILYERGDYIELDELTDYLDDQGIEYLDVEGIEESYREYLDSDGPVTIGGLEFWPSRILEKLDPIAYRCGLTDYTDSLSEDYLVLDF